MADSVATKPAAAPPAEAEVQRALEALRSYGPGSSRGVLQPLDDAVAGSLKNRIAAQQLERELIRRLCESDSIAAREYICSKLNLIATEASIPALVPLLEHEPLATAARRVLQSMPGSAAGKALRLSLEQTKGPSRLGIINSLGVRRETASLRALARLVKDEDVQIVAAAMAAIGELGSSRAATILRAWQRRVPAAFERNLLDASLVCAERLLAAGQKRAAERLYQSLRLQFGIPPRKDDIKTETSKNAG